ncbi:hypothetical protein JQ596_28815 [Bradyrhizobium manausense]|uniref:hypothetical protein n=1 Tax=Bradyrhizobium TaxID=374 RepID=UPI001BAA563D|nr:MULTISPECIES: hypothetical protein [Bradyrhizobium]MBR0829544.1 hypothetical protein [Bradyrhizobium manausense]UVO25914.1 hypothetical protein KUF59_25455 [Bradyrhizobium arachidis]
MESVSEQSVNPRRRLAVVLLLLGFFVAVCLGVMYVAGDLTRLQAAVSERDSRAALDQVKGPEQLDEALKRYPSNRLLKMLALASNDATEIDAAAQRLLSDIEPRALPKLDEVSASSRGDLDALRRDLKTAEGNAATSEARYIALTKAARDKLENDVRSLNVGDGRVSSFMAMIDERHAAWTALTSKMLASRAEYYNAYERCVALLVRDFGIYKVANGQFVFPFQSAANSYNRAAATTAAAAQRSSELNDERTKLRQSQLGRWKEFLE